MAYIASTLAAPVTYTGWSLPSNASSLPVQEWAITIAGGAGVANKRIVTPRGVITEVSDDELKLLQTSEVFKLHLDGGYLSILTSRPYDPDDAAADMVARDNSAPLVDEDFSDKADAPAAVGGRATGYGGKRSKG